MHQLGVGHPLLARGGVDPGDPEATEVALSPAPVAVGVVARALDLLLREAVARVLAAVVALRLLQDLLAPPPAGDRVGGAAHLRPPRLPPSSFSTRGLPVLEISPGRDILRLRFGDFFSTMWLDFARLPRSLPLAGRLEPFL